MNQVDNLSVKARPWIVVVSIAVPALVTLLLLTEKIEGFDTTFLPPIYATLNAFTAVFLVAALLAIKRKNIVVHKTLMSAAIVFSALFLVLYVIYHSTSDSTPFGGVGNIRVVYFTLLLSHILLSVVVIPLVLITYVRALAQRFDRHKRIARITFPIWLYVAISGVVVYLMISPYYV